MAFKAVTNNISVLTKAETFSSVHGLRQVNRRTLLLILIRLRAGHNRIAFKMESC